MICMFSLWFCTNLLQSLYRNPFFVCVLIIFPEDFCVRAEKYTGKWELNKINVTFSVLGVMKSILCSSKERNGENLSPSALVLKWSSLDSLWSIQSHEYKMVDWHVDSQFFICNWMSIACNINLCCCPYTVGPRAFKCCIRIGIIFYICC